MTIEQNISLLTGGIALELAKQQTINQQLQEQLEAANQQLKALQPLPQIEQPQASVRRLRAVPKQDPPNGDQPNQDS